MKPKTTKKHARVEPTNGLKPLIVLFAVTLTLAASSIPTKASLVAHWKFDESSGTVAHDSGGSFNGNLSPGGAAFVPGGISGNAISLSRAANGFVNMGNVLGLTSGDFSIVAWIKMNPGDRTDTTLILSKQAAYTRNGYFLAVNKSGTTLADDKASFYEGGTGVAPITIAETPISTTSVNDGNWHQVVAVYQAGGNKSIYVDGAPAEDVKPSQAFVGNSVALLVGGLNYSGIPTGVFTGLIDDLQIYNSALSDGNVDFLFQHPGQVVPDCSQQLAAVLAQLAVATNANATLQAQLAACNTTLATANQNVQQLQNEIRDLLLPLELLTLEFREMFDDPHFQIRGETSVEQMQNLVAEILSLPRGQQRGLYLDLGGSKRNRIKTGVRTE